MALAVVNSRAQVGVNAPRVDVEVHLSGGLPVIAIVGLPEAAVRESRDRVRAAIVNAHFEFPQRRATINLAPADLPKDGGRFDLPIALGILAASGQLPLPALEGHEFLGELALSGELRGVVGVLPAVLKARRLGRVLVLPADNAAEAGLVAGVDVRVARSLLEVCAHLRGVASLPRATAAPPADHCQPPQLPDLAEVRGQPLARRALEIAAAGAHNLLMIGPPGTGKTMLATRLAGILPPMDEDEALESAAVRSVAGLPVDATRFRERPTRAPHHSASAAALIGGGSIPRPGEASLAHHGVLFLDELPEFDRHVLENLREPLESGRVLISRAARQAEFPARFQLVAAMNPCPCGHLGDPSGRCRCTAPPAAVEPARRRARRRDQRHRARARHRRPRARPAARRQGQRRTRPARGRPRLPAARSRRRPAGARGRAIGPLRPRLPPHPAGGAHDRRSCTEPGDRDGAPGGGDRAAAAGGAGVSRIVDPGVTAICSQAIRTIS